MFNQTRKLRRRNASNFITHIFQFSYIDADIHSKIITLAILIVNVLRELQAMLVKSLWLGQPGTYKEII